MNELILLKNNDVFTTSLVIAEGTGNQHKSVVALVKKHIEYFRKFGSIEFSDLKSLNYLHFGKGSLIFLTVT